MTLFLSEEDVDQLLPIEVARHEVRRAFESLASRDALNYPRQRGGSGSTTINAMWAISGEVDAMGAKIYPIVRTDVTQSPTSTFLLYSARTGQLDAVLEAEVLGQRRTGAASAVATQALARADSETLTVIGSGWQAGGQVAALVPVLPNLRRVVLSSRAITNACSLAQLIEATQQVHVEIAGSIEEAVASADVLVTATGSTAPVFDGAWLSKGVHINAVGSNYPTKREIDPTTVGRASVIVVDSRAVAAVDCGDLLLNGGDIGSTLELGDVLTRAVPGRRSPEQITLFESHGLAIEDLMCAKKVFDRAVQESRGVTLPVRPLSRGRRAPISLRGLTQG